MRRISTPPYCKLRTKRIIKFKTYDKRMRVKTVHARFTFDSFWHPAHTLEELLTAGKGSLMGRYGVKTIDAKRGLVNKEPVELRRTNTFPQVDFTAKELNAPRGYRYWSVDPVSKLVTVSCFSTSHLKDIAEKTPLGIKMLADPRYRAPLIRPLPKGWKIIEPFSGIIMEHCRTTKLTTQQLQDGLYHLLKDPQNEELNDIFNWPYKNEIVSQLFRRRSPRIAKGSKFVEVSGGRLKPAEKALYRLLHYWSPIRIEDFYKGHVLRLYHPTGDAWIDVETWKCEMATRFYVKKEKCVVNEAVSAIRLGMPGGHNTEVDCDITLRKWYNLFLRLISTKTMIYSGNNFEV